MTPLRVAVLASLLFTPLNSSAATITDVTFETELDTESIHFGLQPFTWLGPPGSIDVRGTAMDFDSGSISLISGALQDLVTDGSTSTYNYGAETLAIHALFGSEEGIFTTTTLPFSIIVCEGCDPHAVGNSLAEDFSISLGSGLFNEVFARALGIDSKSGEGEVNFGLEDIFGDPDSERDAADHRGAAQGTVSVSAALPEPTLLTLTLIATGGWIARRRTRQP